MRLILVLMLVVLSGCYYRSPRVLIGEKVTNGICQGWVSAETLQDYKVMPWICKGTTFDFVWVPKEQVRSVHD